jgi:hypothetical protein
MDFKATIFKSNENENELGRYLFGHDNVLTDLGFKELIRSSHQVSKESYLINVTHTLSNKVIAGIRIQPSFNATLPIEEYGLAISSNLFNTRKNGAEICGAWVSKDFQKMNFAQFLTDIAVSFCLELGLNEIVMLNSLSRLDHGKNVGFKLHPLLSKSTFDFPTSEFPVHIVYLNEKLFSSSTHNAPISEILNLKNGVYNLINSKGVFNIGYNINKPSKLSEKWGESLITPELYLNIINRPELLENLHWRQFEKLIADILESNGYEIDLMQGTKDGGIDVIAFQESYHFGKHKYLLQAKRYKNKIGVDIIREVLFCHDHYGATKSCLATTSNFTKGARDLATEERYKWNLELKNHDAIYKWVTETWEKKNGLRV